ncbi:hypothetical protein [Caldivirga sp. MU80]|nr:hypothetical protein [Caldivirga sp. MU80]
MVAGFLLALKVVSVLEVTTLLSVSLLLDSGRRACTKLPTLRVSNLDFIF